MREKLGLSKPRNSGFGRGSFNLEGRDVSAYWISVDGGREGGAGHSASNSPPLEVKRDGFSWMRDAVGLSVGLGLQLLSLVRACSMLRAQERGN